MADKAESEKAQYELPANRLTPPGSHTVATCCVGLTEYWERGWSKLRHTVHANTLLISNPYSVECKMHLNNFYIHYTLK